MSSGSQVLGHVFNFGGQLLGYVVATRTCLVDVSAIVLVIVSVWLGLCMLVLLVRFVHVSGGCLFVLLVMFVYVGVGCLFLCSRLACQGHYNYSCAITGISLVAIMQHAAIWLQL